MAAPRSSRQDCRRHSRVTLIPNSGVGESANSVQCRWRRIALSRASGGVGGQIDRQKSGLSRPRQPAQLRQRPLQRILVKQRQASKFNPGRLRVALVDAPRDIQIDDRDALRLRVRHRPIEQASRAGGRFATDAMGRAAEQAAIQQLVKFPQACRQGRAGARQQGFAGDGLIIEARLNIGKRQFKEHDLRL